MKTKKENSIEDVYKTRDLFEVAAISLQQKPIRLEPKDNYLVFVFKKIPAEEIANAYWNGTLAGNIREYVSSIKATKDYLFSRKRMMDEKE
jgi:hypothetical protein